MENIKEKEVININIDKLKEKQWMGIVIFVFSITPFVLTFYFLERIIAFNVLNSISSIMFMSILLQIPVLIIGMPLYYISNKLRKPEKKSEREYEFLIKTYKTIHFFMSSFWTSGFYGTIIFIIYFIFNLSQGFFILMLFGYLLLRLLIMIPIYLFKKLT